MSEQVKILYEFFGFWQLTIGLFAFIALLSIWHQITKDQHKNKKDYGLMWLSLAILAWAVSGIVDILYARQILDQSTNQVSHFEGTKSILSMINSAFILLALPCFKHCPPILRNLVQSDSWRFIVVITLVFSTLLTIMMMTGILIPSKIEFIYSVDFIYAIFTLIFLGMILWSSFAIRGLKILAFLSVTSIGLTLIAQLLKLDDNVFWQIFFSCTFKTVLIMLFFALALSWIKELSTTYLPKPFEMYLVFSKQKTNGNKFDHKIILTVPPSIQTQQINLTEKPYNLLQKFAEKKIQGENNWLEMRPKSRKDGLYDINDYNEINRILEPILNSTFDGKNWSSEDRNQLKQAIFDYHQNRKIQLRIDPKNITLENQD